MGRCSGALVMVVAALAVGCKGKGGAGGAGAKLSSTEARALIDMTKGLEAIHMADPSHQVRLLAELLGEVGGPEYAGFAEYAHVEPGAQLQTLAEKTDFFCKKPDIDTAVGASPAEKMQRLVAVCGADYYGLPAGQTQLMSTDWFVVQRAGAWLAKTRAKAVGDKDFPLAKLDAAMTAARFPLLLPVRAAGYDLLPHAVEQSELAATSYVIVSADTLSAAAMPAVTLVAGGVQLADVPGGPFPGAPAQDGADSLDALIDAFAAKARTDAGAQPDKAQLEKPEPVPVEEEEAEAAPDEAGGYGIKQANEEGKMGKKDSARATGQYKMKRQPLLSKEERIEAARKSGILAVMSRQHTAFFRDAEVTVSADAPVVLAAAKLPAARVLEVIGQLSRHGARLGVQHGEIVAMHATAFGTIVGHDQRRHGNQVEADGLHVVMTDDALVMWADAKDLRQTPNTSGAYDFAALKTWLAENDGPETIGVHVTGTRATVQDLTAVLDAFAQQGIFVVMLDPAPEGIHSGIGPAGINDGPKPPIVPKVDIGEPTTVASMDKAIIRKYIGQKKGQFQDCYEKELINNPMGLAGTVTVTFTILTDGTIYEVEASGIGNRSLEGCVADTVQSIRFPKPPGDAVVKVSYPFTFSASP